MGCGGIYNINLHTYSIASLCLLDNVSDNIDAIK